MRTIMHYCLIVESDFLAFVAAIRLAFSRRVNDLAREKQRERDAVEWLVKQLEKWP